MPWKLEVQKLKEGVYHFIPDVFRCCIKSQPHIDCIMIAYWLHNIHESQNSIQQWWEYLDLAKQCLSIKLKSVLTWSLQSIKWISACMQFDHISIDQQHGSTTSNKVSRVIVSIIRIKGAQNGRQYHECIPRCDFHTLQRSCETWWGNHQLCQREIWVVDGFSN